MVCDGGVGDGFSNVIYTTSIYYNNWVETGRHLSLWNLSDNFSVGRCVAFTPATVTLRVVDVNKVSKEYKWGCKNQRRKPVTGTVKTYTAQGSLGKD